MLQTSVNNFIQFYLGFIPILIPPFWKIPLIFMLAQCKQKVGFLTSACINFLLFISF
jgi:hypothetical protein